MGDHTIAAPCTKALFREILENPPVVSRIYAAPDDCALDDRVAWHAANPTLGTIKQLSYMENQVERLAGVASDEPDFRAFDLNQEIAPDAEPVCTPDELRACFVDELPARSGPCFLGFDFGEATSATAACAIWPSTGRMETWLGFGDVPVPGRRVRATGRRRYQSGTRRRQEHVLFGHRVCD